MGEEIDVFLKESPQGTLGDNLELLSLTTHIVAAQLSAKPVDASDIAGIIHEVYTTLSTIVMTPHQVSPIIRPSVSVQESVHPDYIICLEDGKKLKMLKRHLRTTYNMTPEQYRNRWGLANTYPMVAPNYATKRSQLAKNIGLGIHPRKTPHKRITL
ncbi:MAG: MucR family transcriptional regulator [Holosporales bacterium]|jgi:predicted transcriptional regulator|nr:MucR family transcriptional regulator [Holosporales bacterium]